MLFTSKQHCLKAKRYDQCCGLMKIYTPTDFLDLILFCFQDVLNLRKKKKMEKKMNTTSHHSAIHL